MTEIITGETLEEIREALQERIQWDLSLPTPTPDPTAAIKNRIRAYVKFRTFVNGGDCNADNGHDAQKSAWGKSKYNAGAIAGCEDLLRHVLNGDFDNDVFNERCFNGPRGDQFRCTYRGII